MSHDTLPGRVIDRRYRVVKRLGQGGMGIVYRVEHVGLRRAMAMKVLHPHTVADEAQFKRFQREAQAASRVGHEGIVYVSDTGYDPEAGAWFVMELLDGEPLSRRIDRVGRLTLIEALDLAWQAADAVRAAHEAQIVHRDIKPDNIFLVRGATGVRVKILDFGIARVLDRTKLTHTGGVLGSVHYMSPEQAGGEPVGPSSDIYSLGVTLYEMVCGEPPFQADNQLALIYKHLSEPPAPPSLRAPDALIPPILDHLILDMLRKDPAERPASMEDVQARMTEAREELLAPPTAVTAPPAATRDTVPAMPATDSVPDLSADASSRSRQPAEAVVSRFTTMGGSAAESVRPEHAPARPPRRRSWFWPVAGGVAILGAAAVALLMVQGMPGESTPVDQREATPPVAGRTDEKKLPPLPPASTPDAPLPPAIIIKFRCALPGVSPTLYDRDGSRIGTTPFEWRPGAPLPATARLPGHRCTVPELDAGRSGEVEVACEPQ